MQVSVMNSYQRASIVSYNIVRQRGKEYHFNYVWYILYLDQFVVLLNNSKCRRYNFL